MHIIQLLTSVSLQVNNILGFIFIVIARGWNLVVWFSFPPLIISTDAIALVEEIQKGEPLITASCKEHVIHLVRRLQEKLGEKEDHKFCLFKVKGIFNIILGILGGFSCDVVSMFLLLHVVPESKIWTLWPISWLFSITSALFRATESGLLMSARNSPKRLGGITVPRLCLHRLM